MMTIVQVIAALASCIAVYFAYRGVEVSAASHKGSLAPRTR